MNPLKILAMIPLEALKQFLSENEGASISMAIANIPVMGKAVLQSKIDLTAAEESLVDCLNFIEDLGYTFKESELRQIRKGEITVYDLLMVFAKPLEEIVAYNGKEDDGERDAKAFRLSEILNYFSKIGG